jgi:hypothetical protein
LAGRLPVPAQLHKPGPVDPEKPEGPVPGIGPELQHDLIRCREKPEICDKFPALEFDLVLRCLDPVQAPEPDKDNMMHGPDHQVAGALKPVLDPHHAAPLPGKRDGIVQAADRWPALAHGRARLILRLRNAKGRGFPACVDRGKNPRQRQLLLLLKNRNRFFRVCCSRTMVSLPFWFDLSRGGSFVITRNSAVRMHTINYSFKIHMFFCFKKIFAKSIESRIKKPSPESGMKPHNIFKNLC